MQPKRHRFGLFRFRSPLLPESRLIYVPPATEMFHFAGLPRTDLWIQSAVPWVYHGGLPHSEIPGSRLVCSSPRLIAAYHVLHRLLAPRHSPHALSSLTLSLITIILPSEKTSDCTSLSTQNKKPLICQRTTRNPSPPRWTSNVEPNPPATCRYLRFAV